MLERLTRDLRSGTRDGLIRAARQAYALALGVLAVPGVVLGAIMIMFLILFRSMRIAVLCIIPNIIAAALVLGFAPASTARWAPSSC